MAEGTGKVAEGTGKVAVEGLGKKRQKVQERWQKV